MSEACEHSLWYHWLLCWQCEFNLGLWHLSLFLAVVFFLAFDVVLQFTSSHRLSMYVFVYLQGRFPPAMFLLWVTTLCCFSGGSRIGIINHVPLESSLPLSLGWGVGWHDTNLIHSSSESVSFISSCIGQLVCIKVHSFPRVSLPPYIVCFSGGRFLWRVQCGNVLCLHNVNVFFVKTPLRNVLGVDVLWYILLGSGCSSSILFDLIPGP